MAESDRNVTSDLEIVLPCRHLAKAQRMSPEYGETELKRLCDKFLMPSNSVLKNDYRDFKESLGSNAGLSFTNFQNSIATLPVSTAVCERG